MVALKAFPPMIWCRWGVPRTPGSARGSIRSMTRDAQENLRPAGWGSGGVWATARATPSMPRAVLFKVIIMEAVQVRRARNGESREEGVEHMRVFSVSEEVHIQTNSCRGLVQVSSD